MDPPLDVRTVVLLAALDGVVRIVRGLDAGIGTIGTVPGGPLALAVVVLGVAQILGAAGLWTRTPAAWRGTVAVLSLGVLADVPGLLEGPPGILDVVVTVGLLASLVGRRDRFVRE